MNERDEAPLDGPSVDWPLRTESKVRGGLRFLERLTLGAERPVGKGAFLGPGADHWNEGGMHHIDAHQLTDGLWVACVDGFRSQKTDIP